MVICWLSHFLKLPMKSREICFWKSHFLKGMRKKNTPLVLKGLTSSRTKYQCLFTVTVAHELSWIEIIPCNEFWKTLLDLSNITVCPSQSESEYRKNCPIVPLPGCTFSHHLISKWNPCDRVLQSMKIWVYT